MREPGETERERERERDAVVGDGEKTFSTRGSV